MNEALEKLNKLKNDMPSLKRPRHYAEHICNLKTREERAKALAEVPEEFMSMVKSHVETFFMTRKAKR
jgi:hypothetical protein